MAFWTRRKKEPRAKSTPDAAFLARMKEERVLDIGLRSDSPTAAPPPVQLAPESSNQQQSRRAAFPWSIHHLTLPPPIASASSKLVPSTKPSPSPFPRYGHSLPLVATRNGELYLFGGLVQESYRSDLYLFSTRDLSATTLHTVGDLPSPRIGHASALVENVLIVWGGGNDLNDQSHKLDDGLYFFNALSREWTRVLARGDTPVGRYGHSVVMVGPKFFVFGGQSRGEFFDDLWAFDLNSLRTTPVWERYQPAGGKVPSPRTGHVCVAFDQKIYMFGGTDGQYHYNDTWSFDVATRTWEELDCIGFTPAPREGHAAALTGDVMYIFGGRGVDGKDLGDLGAFRISNNRWYMFQNMGPTPSGRSGHAMASFGTRIFVLGGESYGSTNAQEDTNVIHVLDTKHIKYPETSKRPSLSGGSKVHRQRIDIASDDHLQGATSPPLSSDAENSRPTLPDVMTSRHINEAIELAGHQFNPEADELAASPPSTGIKNNMHYRKDTDLNDKLEGSDINGHGLGDMASGLLMPRDKSPSPSAGNTPGFRSDVIPNLSEHIYNIQGPRRSGGFCDIYVGELERDDQRDKVEQVAMKMLRVFSTDLHVVKAKKKFRREVELWRLLRHPNVLPFYGTCEIDENRLFMVSPWAQGGNSLEYLRQNPTADRGKILWQTSGALEYLHSGKDAPQIVHGDLKADNVLISATGDALLSDFGLSRHVEEVMSMTTTSSTGIAGHIRFMAPELIVPPQDISRPSKPTPASDVFAFASLMLQIYTEKPPFTDLSEVQVMFKVIHGVLPPRPAEANILKRGFNDGVWTLMTHCWEFDAGKRPTMEEVRKPSYLPAFGSSILSNEHLNGEGHRLLKDLIASFV